MGDNARHVTLILCVSYVFINNYTVHSPQVNAHNLQCKTDGSLNVKCTNKSQLLKDITAGKLHIKLTLNHNFKIAVNSNPLSGIFQDSSAYPPYIIK